jgi:hypothetical protein
VIVVGPNRKQHVIRYWDLTSGSFISLGKKVTWHIAHSKTGKIIPITLELEAIVKVNPFWRFGGQSTIVSKLTPAEVCVVGRVPAGPYELEDLSRLRGWAQNMKCSPVDNIGRKDRLGVVFGLTHLGRYEEAKAALKEIASPGTRTVAYIDIARAEAESGHQENARATILQGWNDLLTQKDATNFFNDYGMEESESVRDADMIRIIGVMAAIGLYDDAYDKLKAINGSQLPEVLLVIGQAQGSPRSRGGNEDPAAAQATFTKGIELALTHADTSTADGQLSRILDMQLEVGLFNEAKQTLLLIKGAMTKQAAEYSIRIRTPR